MEYPKKEKEYFLFPKELKEIGLLDIIEPTLENAIRIDLNEFEYLHNNDLTYIDLNKLEKGCSVYGTLHPFFKTKSRR